ncbi:acetate uptake transporter family protein ASCRUDRAFT_74111 [Ascoidea rubescens DSM 1968]|uniref:Uncharacterized protein n=1 Tax=Ascoidea rubescens DSM 1968 TaxID=1344418 RepID=A0A1D2VSE1_9ASCO|nr:hypothetical protein ASCRUDRAFT_74111 [Ascoidea rubescens DSM 1968]ODV64498.1 hypothetical protein ASCRUDRAFT_74111 [Ascoidea rubescens DSM 1968]
MGADKYNNHSDSDSEHEDYDNFVYVGNTKVNKDDLIKTLCLSKTMTNTPNNSNQQVNEPKQFRQFANPGPLGLTGFALTTFVFSLAQARFLGVSNVSIASGVAFFYGGFIQFVAGIFQFINGNTFGTTAFGSYGGFWMAWGAVHTPAFGMKSQYEDETQWDNAVGFFNLSWAIFTFIISICTMKDTVAFCALLWISGVGFLLNAIAKFTQSLTVARIGGCWGIAIALLAWFIAFTELATPENSYIVIKSPMMPRFGAEKAKQQDLEKQN